MNRSILITGATGNVGQAVIRSLFEQQDTASIIAGVRDIDKSRQVFEDLPELQYRAFDFEKSDTFRPALEGIDSLFLLRPPHISNIDPIFAPLILCAIDLGVRQVVLLSVQGADKMSFIPHAKIEKIITQSNLDYCFLRPSYFMQNLTTTLKKDIEAGCIVLPAGRAVFNWVDVSNIAQVAAIVLTNPNRFRNQSLEITGSQNLSFDQVVQIINRNCSKSLRYRNANLIAFYKHKKRQGVPRPMILVMIMLHLLPRFQKPPKISRNYQLLTGKEPISLKEFSIANLK